MATKVAALVIHGIGDQPGEFADEFIEEVEQWLQKTHNLPKGKVAFEPVHWAPILETTQRELFNEMNQRGELDFIGLRQFVMSALSDAASYRKIPGDSGSAYERIHEEITDSLRRLEHKLGVPDDLDKVPLVVIAHSLGGFIMSNHIWDEQKTDADGNRVSARGKSPFQRMDTLASFVTFGCNIPLFVPANVVTSKVQPIQVPSGPLKARNIPDLDKVAGWFNYYDPDDILGWPINPLYAKAGATPVVHDKAINAGGWLAAWNPASHSKYWTDNDFTKPVARHLAELLALAL